MTPIELTPLISLGPLLPEIPELLAGLLLLGLLWLIIAKAVAPRFEELYESRSSQIEGGIRHAEQVQAEAAQAREQYQSQLTEIRESAAKAREDARARGEQILHEAKDSAAQEQARMMAEARVQLATERESATAQLTQQVGSLATALAGRIVGESLEDDERTRRTVDRFLAELKAQPAKASISGE